MNITIFDKNVPSSDGKHTLRGRVYRPEGEIRGLFHIVHGMIEHIDRYDHLFKAAAEQGFLCFGYDNLGHGKTAETSEELGFIASKDGHRLLVEDVARFEDEIRREYPGLPLVLMGHSMGSFIARLAAVQNAEHPAGLVICGTGGPQPASALGLRLTELTKRTRGERHISPMIEGLVFSGYNRRFKEEDKRAWLTKDRSVIERYANDPLCNYHFTVSAMHDLIMLNSLANGRDWFAGFPAELPVLLVSGDMDPVGDYGRGVKRVYKELRAAGVRDVALRLYHDCRHEIHNDTCRDEMIAELLHFLRKTTGAAKT